MLCGCAIPAFRKGPSGFGEAVVIFKNAENDQCLNN